MVGVTLGDSVPVGVALGDSVLVDGVVGSVLVDGALVDEAVGSADDVLGAGVAGVTLGSAPAGDAVTTPAPSITVTAPNAVRYRMTASSGETRPLLPPSRWAAGQPASRSRPSPWWATRLISANRSIAAAIPWSTDGRKPAGPTRK